MRKIVASLLGSLLWLALAGWPSALSAENASRKKVDFIHEVQPILRETCYSCHGPEKKKGSLRLDIKALAMKGGENGPAIVPGNSSKSPLAQRLLSTDSDDRMPQKAEPLPPDKIKLIHDWIDQGANWPEAVAGADPAKHWAFQPLKRSAPPKVKNKSWARTDIDRFILAKLEAKGLKPVADADKATVVYVNG